MDYVAEHIRTRNDLKRAAIEYGKAGQEYVKASHLGRRPAEQGLAALDLAGTWLEQAAVSFATTMPAEETENEN